MLKNRIHSSLICFGKPCPVTDLFGVEGRRLLEQMEIPEPWRGDISASVELIDHLERQIDQTNKRAPSRSPARSSKRDVGVVGVTGPHLRPSLSRIWQAALPDARVQGADGWTRQKAEEELQNVLADVRRELWRPPTPETDETIDEPTFHEFASEWFEAFKDEGVRPTTLQGYEWQLCNHLLPYFASHRLSEITIAEVDRYRQFKVREGRRSDIDQQDDPAARPGPRRGNGARAD